MKSNHRPSQWRAFRAMTLYTFKAFVRNRATVIFGFVFPLVFISVFGLLGSSSQSLNLGIPQDSNQSNPVVSALKSLSFVKIQNSDEGTLEGKLSQGKIDGIVAVTSTPPTYLVKLITNSGNPNGTALATSTIEGMTDKINLTLAGVKQPPITLTKSELSGRTYRYIDFFLPGQIGFSILSMAMFSTVFGFIALKRLLVFKRMFATPVHPLTILLAQGTARMIMSLAQVLVIILIGVLVFNFYLPHGVTTLLEIVGISIFGLVAFMGFGIFASGFASDENSAGPMVNLITLPQFLLSGVFFSTDAFPAWVQPIANNLPLSYFNQAIRKITTEGGSLHDTIPYLLGLTAWGMVMYLLAARTFKWET